MAAKVFQIGDNTASDHAVQFIIGGSNPTIKWDAANTQLRFQGDGATNHLSIDNAGDVSIANNLSVDGNLTIDGDLILGNQATDTITIGADISSNILPSADNTYDIGATGSEWKDLYVTGTAYLDAISTEALTSTGAIKTDTALQGTSTTLDIKLSTSDGSDTGVTRISGGGGMGGGSRGGEIQLHGEQASSNPGSMRFFTGTTAGSFSFTNGDLAVDTDTLFVDVSENAVTMGTTVLVGDARLTVQGENAVGHDGVYSAQNGALGYCYVANNDRNDTTLDGGVFRALRNGTVVGGLADTGVGGYFGTWSITDAAILTGETNVRLFADDTTGNIGIGTGTAAPDALLEISGSGTGTASVTANTQAIFGNTGSSSDTSRVSIVAGTAGYSVLDFGDTAVSKRGAVAYKQDEELMIFNTNTTDQMWLDSSGNLGVGTAVPATQLHLTRTATEQTNGLRIQNDQAGGYGSAIGIYSKQNYSPNNSVAAAEILVAGTENWSSAATQSSSIEFKAQVDGTLTQHMVLSGGKVGIGVAAPYSLLELSQNTATALVPTNVVTGTKEFVIRNTAAGAGVYGAVSFTNTGNSQNRIASIYGVSESASNTGMALGFATRDTAGGNTAERMRINSDGKVGIGVADPDHLLEINNSDGASMLKLERTTGNTGTASFSIGGGDPGFNLVVAGTSGDFTVNTGAAERIRLDASGNVGIGTGAPDLISNSNYPNVLTVFGSTTGNDRASLEIASRRSGAASEVGRLSFWNSESGGNRLIAGIIAETGESGTSYATERGQLGFYTTTTGSSGGGVLTERMRINSDGYVGIGTAAPKGLIHAYTADAGSATALSSADEIIIESNDNAGLTVMVPDGKSGRVLFTSPSSTGSAHAEIQSSYESGNLNLNTNKSGGYIAFLTDTASEAMRIGSDGSVGIGTDDPDNNLHIESDSAAAIRVETTANADADIIFQTGDTGIGRVGVDFQSAKAMKMNATGSLADNHLVVSTDGDVGIGTGAPINHSDYAGLSISDTNGGLIHLGDFATGHYGQIIGDQNGVAMNIPATVGLTNQLLKLKAGPISGGTDGHLIIDSNGNVAIGGVTPDTDTNLHIYENDASAHVTLKLQNASATSGIGSQIQLHDHDSYWYQTIVNGELRFFNGGEALTIDSSRNVGIGTTEPDGKLHVWTGSAGSVSAHANGDNLVIEDSSSNTGMTFLSPDDSVQYIYFGDASEHKRGNITYNHSTDRFSIATAGQDNLIINSSGKVGIGTTSFNSGGGKLQVADGISFPEAQSASSDPNTLDDYEEGTWTPAFYLTGGSGVSIGYSNQTGRYTKIGRLVQCSFRISVSSFSVGSGSGYTRIEGLPFTCESLSEPATGIAQFGNIDLPTGAMHLGAKVAGNSAIIELATSFDNDGTVGLGPNALNSGTIIEAQVVYHV